MKRYTVSDRSGKILFVAKSLEEIKRRTGIERDRIKRMIKKVLDYDVYLIKAEEMDPEYVWMVVTHDKYELPIAIFDSGAEMARALHLSKADIHSAMTHARQRGCFCKYKKVYVGDDD